MYRIKEKQKWTIFRFFAGIATESYGQSVFYVQYKYKCLPFWVSVTSAFDTQKQAENHI